jgi:hypothetical protein
MQRPNNCSNTCRIPKESERNQAEVRNEGWV